MYSYLIGLIEPILHGASNIVDSHFSNEVFKRLSTIVFFNVIISFLFLPIIFLFGLPSIPETNHWGWILIISLVEVFYIFPYTASLRENDTSIVCSLFSLSKLFVPVMAFLFVGEKLYFIQYIGFIFIIIGSLFLSINKSSGIKFKINKSFFFMLLVAFLLSVTNIIEKYLLNDSLSFFTLFFWTHLLSLIFIIPFLIIKPLRVDIMKSIGLLKNNFPLFTFQAFLDFGGNAGSLYTISLLPVTIASGLSGTQPIFVIFISYLTSFFYPNMKETLDKKNVIKKIILFIFILIGIILII